MSVPWDVTVSDVQWTCSQKEERCPPGQKAATLNWSSAANKCREIQKKKSCKSIWSIVNSRWRKLLSQFWFCVCFLQKAFKSPSTCFLEEMVKPKMKVREREPSSLCCLQAVQAQVWEAPSKSVHFHSPGWKVGGKHREGVEANSVSHSG